ncbi:hypothetical protein ABZ897_01760 [Nonomuraea sp. NPDC046802]|uniref:hypothetical protein n=1 Tax=Nonomuraea sp. NPDC046802 TaxID=3154919 RepID=UPI0033C3BDC5
MSGEQRRFELSVPQILGSALAAVTAAVASSYLGVAGTVIGAAVVSIASTVATAIYTHYLKTTGERVKQRTGRRDESAEPERPDDDDSTLELPVVRRLSWVNVLPALKRLSWVKLGAAAAVVFAVSMGGILLYQGLAQRTVHEQVTGQTPRQAQMPENDRRAPVEQPSPQRDEQRQSDAPEYTPETIRQTPLTPTPSPTPTTKASKTSKPTPTPTPTAPRTSAPPPPSVEEEQPPVETPPPDEPLAPADELRPADTPTS